MNQNEVTAARQAAALCRIADALDKIAENTSPPGRPRKTWHSTAKMDALLDDEDG